MDFTGKSPLHIMAVLTAIVFLTSCGGGGGKKKNDGDGGGGGGTTKTVTFTGGSLEDLKNLSSSLTFDHLEITGGLSLPLYSDTTITANKLTIAATGGVGYSYTDCQYVDAPGITFNVSGDVLIEGNFTLNGRNGTSVTSTATCNSCYGQDGGDITVTGKNIKVTSSINNYGGGGASTRYLGGSSYSCSAGGSGDLKLAVTESLDLSGAKISNQAGKNFNDVRGPSGKTEISAGGAFIMQNGFISSTGAMTFAAQSTDIRGVISYGNLEETIGGQPDTTAPSVTILAPQANASIPWRQPFEIKVQATDTGMGVRNVQIKGLGADNTYSISDFEDTTLTATIESPELPETLEVIVKDNKGNIETISVTGLKLQYPAEEEPNDDFLTAQPLAKGGIIQGTIKNGDPGYVWSSAPPAFLEANKDGVYKIEDFYEVTCCEQSTCGSGIWTYTCYYIGVELDFKESAAMAASKPDIDIYLFNAAGSIIKSSKKDNVNTDDYTEFFYADFNYTNRTGEKFYIGVQSWNVPETTDYRIKY